MRRALAARPALAAVEVGSAGVAAVDGARASASVVRVLEEEFGLDLRTHRARRLTADLAADLVLAVDASVAAQARACGVSGRVELLGDYAGFPGEEVADPYLGSLDEYRRCARQLERLVEATANRLEREQAREGAAQA